MDIGIGKINRESGIVILNHRAQQQRPLALEPEFVPRQKPGVVEIEPLGPGADDANVTIIIEDRESIAVFQAPQRPLDEGALDFDIVLGQLYRRVRDIFYTARRRMRVITDVRSPRKVRCAAIQSVTGIPPLPPGARRFSISSGIYRLSPPGSRSARRLSTQFAPKPVDLTRGHGRHGNRGQSRSCRNM
jgi:hypothetical protein